MIGKRSTKKRRLETGRRLRRAREAVGLSQRQLAVPDAWVSPAFISRIEHGDRGLTERTAVVLAPKLGVSALYLLTGDATSACPLCGRAESLDGDLMSAAVSAGRKAKVGS